MSTTEEEQTMFGPGISDSNETFVSAKSEGRSSKKKRFPVEQFAAVLQQAELVRRRRR